MLLAQATRFAAHGQHGQTWRVVNPNLAGLHGFARGKQRAIILVAQHVAAQAL